MNVNKWTLGLAAVGLVTLPTVTQAEESFLKTALSSTTFSGYVNTSVHWNPGRSGAAPVSFNGGKADGFNLNVVDLTIEKPLDEGTWSAGYKVELWFGPDATTLGNQLGGATTIPAATPGDPDTIVPSSDQVSLKQAYIALRAPVGNGLDFKIGTWDTIIGYEVANGHQNPNYTRSYGYTLEPTQHTGILASYQVNEMIGVTAGIANTWDANLGGRSSVESVKTYMGGVSVTAPQDAGWLAGSTFYAGAVYGPRSGASGAMRETSLYVGGTANTPIKNLKVGAAFDLHDTGSASILGGGSTADAWTVAGYASYQLCEKASIHGRAEWVDVASGGPKVFAATATLQYDLWANVLSRLEVRWDRAAGGGASLPSTSGGGPRRNAFQVAANFIYKF